ncbi:hypothetical protein Hanom_Chr02g00165621 [Helianthus anomalus]
MSSYYGHNTAPSAPPEPHPQPGSHPGSQPGVGYPYQQPPVQSQQLAYGYNNYGHNQS